MIDTCAFCGAQYHPMPVYTRGQAQPGRPAPQRQAGRKALRNYWLQDWPQYQEQENPPPPAEEDLDEQEKFDDLPPVIHVCHYRWDPETKELDLNWSECKKKAEELGYVYRPDLTPSR